MMNYSSMKNMSNKTGSTINKKRIDILEPLFLIYFFYSFTSEIFKFNIPYMGGLLLGFCSAIAFYEILQRNSIAEFRLLTLTVFTSIFFVLIQYLAHNVSIMATYSRPFLIWPLQTLVVVCLTRKSKFLKHLVTVMFIISIARRFAVFASIFSDTSFFIEETSVVVERINSVAGWNGFCALALWMFGWRTLSRTSRIVYWSAALVALFLMLEMTSRGALLAFGVGFLLSFLSVPSKFRFISVIGIGFLIVLLSQLTFFSTYIQNYEARLLEDTGRTGLYTQSIELIMDRPFLGYGTRLIGGVGGFIGKSERIMKSPHNPFFLLILGSGIMPAIPFAATWIIAFKESIKNRKKVFESVDLLPLVACAFIFSNLSNTSFMNYWVIACIAAAFQIRDLELERPKAMTQFNMKTGNRFYWSMRQKKMVSSNGK